ncbi:serine hydrolase [Aquimarina sp. MAR_2010_214]|uniref:serine hydrolase domain-containing protein n=1 Tax=Aquimarina sp. MAR_2010_214 TaxID=1250026 RepID=UPI0013043734|nr:serine hydrolase domain-containing protein [Aquimarina sp. MAR_2010_214]
MNTNSLTSRLDSLFEIEHDKNRFDGTAVIGTKDAIVYKKAIGISNRIWNIPMQIDHRFDICSINKSFIAALILMAVEEGKLSLDDHLTDYINTYSYQGKFNQDITIHNLLNHTAGLPDYDQVHPNLSKNQHQIFKRKHFDNNEYIDFISRIPAISNPNQQFYYSNFAYHLLVIILEDLYQLSFSDLLEQKITKPLQLEHTFSTSNNRIVFENIVEGYTYNKTTKNWMRNQFIDLTLGRRIFSSAEDLYHWGKEMSSPVLFNNKQIELMQTNHVSEINQEISYGYGWVVFDGKRQYRIGDIGVNKKYIIHGGATEGYKSMLINIESGEYIISFLANTGDQTNELDLAKKIAVILYTTENEN